jgi:preprotein translocase subunit SecE
LVAKEAMSATEETKDKPLRRRETEALAGGGGGYWSRVGAFWRNVRGELRRTTFPTAKEVQNTTIITIVAVIFFAVYLFIVDQAWSLIIEGILKLFK